MMKKEKHQTFGCELVGLPWLVKNTTLIDLAMAESKNIWLAPNRHILLQIDQVSNDKKLTKGRLEIDPWSAYIRSSSTSI